MVGSTNRLPIALVLLLHVSLLLALPSSSTEAPTSSTDTPTSSTGATTSPYCEPKDRYTVNPTECVSESHAKGATLNIEENSNLETIKLPSLKRVEYLYISRNPALKTLEINAAASGNQLYVRSNMILGQDSIDKLKRLNFTTLEIGTYGGRNASCSRRSNWRNSQGIGMTEIEGKVEIVGTDWTDLSVLDKITKISSREDAGLEVRGNMRMEKFDLPNLKTVIAMGKTEEERIKIEGNKKKPDPKVFEGITSIQGNSVTGAQNSAGDAGQDGMGTGTLIGVVVGRVIGLIAVVAIVGFAVFWFVIRKKKQQTKKRATTPPKKKTLSSTGSNTDLTGGKKKGDAKPRPQSQPKSKEGLQKSAEQRSKEPADQKAGEQKSADQEKSKQPEKHETSGPKDDLLFPEPE